MWYLILIFSLTTGVTGDMGGLKEPPGPFSTQASCDIAGNAIVTKITAPGSAFRNHAIADHVCIQIN